ncbi:MAG: HD domain-containing protein [Chlorobium sp.]
MKHIELHDMEVMTTYALLDDLLLGYKELLGGDYDSYRNHCMRVFNFCRAFAGDSADAANKIALAALFHDLGIWSDITFDYIVPSQLLARRYLEKCGRVDWIDEIEAMIGEHHKLTRYRVNPLWLVESFRKADWIDISGGMLRFRLPDDYVTDVLEAFPNEGFHKKLAQLSVDRLKTHPFSPLPMVKF